MAEVFFYHLTQTPLEHTLPDLLRRSLEREWKVLVCGTDAKRLEWLDDLLWRRDEEGFLPHGLSGGVHDADQPVLLSQDWAAQNKAEIAMAIDGAVVSAKDAEKFARVCILFDGNDTAAVDAARAQWKSLTDAGLPAVYWSQESGSWARKAEKNTGT